jgi:deazaflavin-dependent oxidoreductase (nitroreductase family)
MAARPNRFWRWLFRAPLQLYRWHCGWLLGHRFLLLIHIGRRTGRRHETVLEVMEYHPAVSEAVVMSGFGHDADWLRNIVARPGAWVAIGQDRFPACHRFLDTPEATRVVADYETRHRLIAPIVRWALTRLAGWPYRGSDGDRRRLVRQLPLIAFRPQS